ncbi:hypothetical protein [Actinoallomurus acaciae]|uniref:Uncharacterized protein n=1 Tax=Actinoallomurus acaciae TaxID=502577 RepID=A0ABV5YS23_9ACTN
MERLRGEAAVWLGAEIARAAHQAPTEGALDALNRLTEHSPEHAAVTTALRREVRLGDKNAGQGPLEQDGPTPPDRTLRPRLRDGDAQDIVERAKNLAADPSQLTPDQGGTHAHHGGTGIARPAHTEYLSMDEVHSALDQLRPSDFGRGVTGWHWSPDGTTLHVETEHWGTVDVKVDIRPQVGKMPGTVSEFHPGKSGEPAELAIAQWAMTREAAVAAGLPTGEVAEAGEVLPTQLRHAVSEATQRASAETARSGQGVVRRVASHVREAVRNDAHVRRLIDDHRYLARQWREATDPAERTRIAGEIDQVAHDLGTAGQTPPEPPWVHGSDGFIPGYAQPTPLSELTGRVHAMAEALSDDTMALVEWAGVHEMQAHQAHQNVETQNAAAAKADGETDRGAPERARVARSQAEEEAREAARNEHIADKYQAAREKAEEARTAYRALESHLENLAADPPSEAQAKVSADAGLLLARRAEEAFREYEKALDNALSPDIVGPDAIITGRLPLRGRLTDVSNTLLTGEGVGHQLSPEGYEHELRAQQEALLSKEGACLPVGVDGTQLRVRMRFLHPVENPYPEMRPKETISGGFREGGQWNAATANHSTVDGFEYDLGKLAQLVPIENHYAHAFKGFMKLFGPGGEYTKGHGWSETGSFLDDARPGDVVNIRGGKVTAVVGVPEYDVWVVHPDGRETPVVHVTTGAHGDVTTATALVSNSYTLEPPRNEQVLQLPPGERAQTTLPRGKVIEMNGLDEWRGKVVSQLEAAGVSLDSESREHLSHILTAETKSHLSAMADTTSPLHKGPLRPIPGTGLVVRTTAEINVDRAVPWAASKSDWKEVVEVGFGGITGSDVYNVSTSVSVSVPILPFMKAIDVLPGHGEFPVSFGPKLDGSRGVTHTETANVGRTNIPVTVARHVGNTVAETFPEGSIVVKAHIYSVKGNCVIGPITHEVSAKARFEESEALRYGLPGDVEAQVKTPDGEVARRPDGSRVLRDDPVPGAPPGRRPALPVWTGDGPGQIRGNPGWASEITGVDEGLVDGMPTFKKHGLVPQETDEVGLPRPSEKEPNEAQLMTQVVNQRKLEELADRVRTEYGQALKASGIKTVLKHVTPHGAPEEYELTTHVKPDFNTWDPEGVSTAKNHVGLGIDSKSNGRTVTRAAAVTGGGEVSGDHKPAEHHSGDEEKLGVSGGGNHESSTSATESVMINDVDIVESGTPNLVGGLTHEVVHTLRNPDGKVVGEWSESGHVKLEIPVDWLPRDDASAPPAPPAPVDAAPPTSHKVAAEAIWRQIDTGDMIDQVQQKFRERGVRPPGSIAIILKETSLCSPGNAARWLGRGLETSVNTDPHGMQPKRYTIKVTGTVGESRPLDEITEVSGKINLSAVGTTRTTGRTNGWNATGSGGGTAHYGADLTDGGSTDVKKTGNTATSHAKSLTSGKERLKIEIDPKVPNWTNVRFRVEISDPDAGWTEHVTVDAPSIYTLSESDALELQEQGELTLSPEAMADVMQRFLDDNLVSDPQVVARQVDPYLARLGEARRAGEPLPALSQDHTAEAFADRVTAVMGVGQSAPAGTLERALAGALRLVATGQEAALPAMVDRTVGTSLIAGYEFHGPDGQKMSVFDGVLNAVSQRSPQALSTDPTLGQRLSDRFDGRTWEGLIDNMFDPWGSSGTLPTRVKGPEGTVSSQQVSVRVQGGFTGRPVKVGHSNHVVHIEQPYTWDGETHTTTHNHSLGGDVDVSNGSADGGSDGTVATGRSRSESRNVGDTRIKLNRYSPYDTSDTPPGKEGMAKIKQAVKFTITADQQPLAPGQTKVKKQPEAPEPVTVELEGYITRWVPERWLRPVESSPAEAGHPDATSAPSAEHPPARPADPRPVPLVGDRYYVHWVEAEHAYNVMRDNFVELLGKGSEREVERQLAHQWSAIARTSPMNFRRMVGEQGYEFHVDFGNRTATTNVHLDLHNLEIEDVGGAEVSQVDRWEHTTSGSVSVGHMVPLSGSVKVVDATTGSGYKRANGAQASQTITDNSGHRHETSEFNQSNHAGLGPAKGTFHMAFSQGRKQIHRTADGEVHLTFAGHELNATREAQEAGDPRGPAWDMASSAGRTRRSPGGPKFDEVRVEDGKGAEALTGAIMRAKLNGGDVFVEVHEGDAPAHRYRVSRDGTVHNEDELPTGEPWTDGGFADAFTALPEPLMRLAADHGINLRRVFEQSAVRGSLADKVRHELANQGVAIPAEVQPVPRDWLAGPQQSPYSGGLSGDGAGAAGGMGA